MSLRLLIVDDEPLARLRLRGLVEANDTPHAVVAGEAENVADALRWLEHQRCDALLLDIAMPGRDGLALADELRRKGADAPALIFVTAHAEHALRAFELEALDYLTKPVRRERLQAALRRVAARRPAPDPDTGDDVIVVNDRGRVVRVPVAEVLYLKAELKYVTLRTATATHLLDESLSELEARLGTSFLRVHRNALVARRHVRALERRLLAGDADEEGGETWAVRLGSVDEWLAVSRRQVAAVREALGG